MRRAPRPGGAGARPAAAWAAGCAIAASLCAAAIVCAGCGAATEPAAIVGHDAGGGVTARLSLSPAAAPVMKPLRLSVGLTDANGQPVAGRAVAFALSMPAMAMPPNRPEVTETDRGVYEARTLLPMGGVWRLDGASRCARPAADDPARLLRPGRSRRGPHRCLTRRPGSRRPGRQFRALHGDVRPAGGDARRHRAPRRVALARPGAPAVPLEPHRRCNGVSLGWPQAPPDRSSASAAA